MNEVISNRDTDTAIDITQATHITQNNNLINYLAYVSTDFCFLVKVIKIIKTTNLTIILFLAIV
jgi:hypothetical protein